MATDNKRKLYDALSQDYDMGSYEQFCADLNDEGKRRKLYDATINEYDFGSWEDFSGQLGYAAPAEAAPAARQRNNGGAADAAAQPQTGAAVDTAFAPVVGSSAFVPDSASWRKEEKPKRQEFAKSSKFAEGDTFSYGGKVYRLEGYDELGHAKVTEMDGDVFTPSGKRINRVMKVGQVDKGVPYIEDEDWKRRRDDLAQRVTAATGVRRAENFSEGGGAALEKLGRQAEYKGSGSVLTDKPREAGYAYNAQSGQLERQYVTPYGDLTTDRDGFERDEAFERAADEAEAQSRLARANELREEIERREKEIYSRDGSSGLLGKPFAPLAKGRELDELLALKGEMRKLQEQYRGYRLGYLQQRRRELSEARLRLSRELREQYKELEHKYGGAKALSEIVANDPQMMAVEASLAKLEDSMRQVENGVAQELNGGEKFWDDFGRGLASEATDFDNWDFGLGNLRTAAAMHRVHDKIGRGEELTDNERGLLSDEMDYRAVMAQFGDLGRGYRWGSITGQSFSFMKDFWLTGGYAGLGKAALTAGAKAALTAGAKAATKIGLKGLVRVAGNGMAKLSANRAGNIALKALGATAEDLLVRAPMMVATVQAPKVMAEAIEKHDGSVRYDKESGVYSFEDGTSWSNAIWQAGADNVIENMSEMSGERFGAVGRFFGARNLTAAALRATNKEVRQMLYSTSQFLSRAGINGYFGEVGEEYYGQLWRTMMGLDAAKDEMGRNLLFSGQWHGDIWGGMALSVGLTGGGAFAANAGLKYAGDAVDYVALQQRIRTTGKRAGEALTAEVWNPLKAIIDVTDNATMGEIADNVVKNKTLTEEQRGAVLDYMEATMVMRGHNLREFVAKPGEAEVAGRRQMSEAYIEGAAIDNMMGRNRALLALNYHGGRVREALGLAADADCAEALKARYGSDDINEIVSGVYADESLDEGQRKAVVEYLTANNRFAGMQQTIKSKIESTVAEQRQFVDEYSDRTDRDNPVLRPAKLKKDDEQVYILSGNVALTSDGTMVDISASDRFIIVRRLDGSVDTIDSADILSLAMVESAAEAKKRMEENTRRSLGRQYAREVNGDIPTAEGATVPVFVVGSDETVDVTVVSKDWTKDELVVEFEDGTQTTVSDDYVQQVAAELRAREYAAEMAEASPEANLEAREATSEADEGGAEAPAQEQNEGFGLEDEVEFGDGVRGRIVDIDRGDVREPRFMVEYTAADGSLRVAALKEAELSAVAAPAEAAPAAPQQNNGSAAEAAKHGQNEALEADASSQQQNEAVSALSQIPVVTDDRGRERRQWTAVEPALAWDGIIEEAGDEETAQAFADNRVELAQRALEKAQKMKTKPSEDLNEFKESERQRKEAVAAAQAELEAWQRIAGVTAERREAEAEAGDSQGGRGDIQSIDDRSEGEVDEHGKPFVVAGDGTTTFGHITSDSGLTPAPIKLSEGFQDETTGKGYGLMHMEANHGEQIRQAGFSSVQEFVSFVAENYDIDNIRVGKRREDGSGTFLIQVTDKHENTLFIELSKDGAYWGVNSGGVFRKGYSHKKETVAKTEPQQPNNAVSSDSSLPTDEQSGTSSIEPNGEPTVSNRKDTKSLTEEQISSEESVGGQGGAVVRQTGLYGQGRDGAGRPAGSGAQGGADVPAGDSQGQGGRGEAGELDNDRIVERRQQIVSHLGTRYNLSEEKAVNGEVFYCDRDGNTNLAIIPDEIFETIGIDPVPFKLTETMGWHVFQNHAKELGLANMDEAIESVLDVINNVDHIRLGRDNSFIFSVENGRGRIGRRAVTIVVNSKTGEFMGIRTSGYDRIKNLEKRPLLWQRGADTAAEDVATSTVTTIKAQQGDEHVGHTEGQGKGDGSKLQTAESEPHGLTSDGKVNALSSDKQADGAESLQGGAAEPAEQGLKADAPAEAAPTAPQRNSLGAAVAAAEAATDTNPTEAQKESGDYQKGHVQVGSFDIAIENPAGSVRSGRNEATGEEWHNTMHNSYGEIEGTEGNDGDKLDVFLSTDIDSWNGRRVYVIDQYNPDGTFDEHKVMLGFNDKDEAVSDYLANYDRGWNGQRRIVATEVFVEDFEKWVESSHRKTKPFAEYAIAQKGETSEEGAEVTPKGDFEASEADKAKKAREVQAAEAKAWGEMDGVERLAVAANDLLTRQEIEAADVDPTIKANALAFLDGVDDLIEQSSYLKVYEHVRNTDGNSGGSGVATDRAQLAGADTAEVGQRGKGDGGGVSSEQVDRERGSADSSTEPIGRADSARDGGSAAGERGSEQVSGEPSGVGDVYAAVGERTGSRDDRQSRGNGGGNRRGGGSRNTDPDGTRAAEAGRGTDSAADSSVEADPLAAAWDNVKSVTDEIAKAGRRSLSLSLVGLNSEQIELLPKLISACARYGYELIKKGSTAFSEWAKKMRESLGPLLKQSVGFSDREVDEWIEKMWNCRYPVDGTTRRVSEWAALMGQEKLRESVRMSLDEKRASQAEAESVGVELCDAENIAATLPYLLPQQQEDVLRAEVQFFDPGHQDAEHGNGKGYMFTNGTGTGKTYTGLGIVKRFVKQGKRRVLILTPSQTKVEDWINDGKNLGLDIRSLDDWGAEHGTPATQEKGEGVVITTYANFRQNKALMEDCFDLIVYDESHRLLENKKGEATAGVNMHYKLSNKNEDFTFQRLRDVNPVYREMIATREEFAYEYQRLVDNAKKATGESNIFHLEVNGYIPPVGTNEWSPATEARFPHIAGLRRKATELERRFTEEERPRLEAQAKEETKRTKVVFLSATPFNTRENLDYAEGYIFSYPKDDGGGYAVPKGRNRFFLDHFGAGYKWRYHRLEHSAENAQALAQQEVEFSDWLQNDLRTMSGRMIDSEFDYSRDFPTVTGEYAGRFNEATAELSRNEFTRQAYGETIGNYNYGSALMESLKVAQVLPRIREHLSRGRKVVVFHRRVESGEPITQPFETIFSRAEALLSKESDKDKKREGLAEIRKLRRRYQDLLEWEKTLDLRMPREQLADAFGAEKIGFFSGKESKKAKNKAVEDFNKDDSGKDIFVVQEASGKEGISLHDRSGRHQRVIITLALPQSPITALQIEGRIYRIGNKSNAIFEYPLLGLDSEMILFGQKFNTQVGTTENLALGGKARNLRESFARGIEERSGDVSLDSQGLGGKEMDSGSGRDEMSGYERAVLDYYGNQKLSGRRDSREGKDYYPTPEPLGYKMVEWGQVSEGESVLEPSAGHGAIARYVPGVNTLTAIEPSRSLFGRLQVKAGGVGRKFECCTFEEYNVVNKHDVVVMNPPFGAAGRMAVDHVAKAFTHLEEGGRIVAIIPRGSTDKKFEQWYNGEKKAVLTGEILLPDITFERAGTAVNCRVVIIDKVSDKSLAQQAASKARRIDLSHRDYGKIEDFFEELEGIDMPARTIDKAAKMRKTSLPVARSLREIKGVKEVRVGTDYMVVSGRGVYERVDWSTEGGELGERLQQKYNKFKSNEEWAESRGHEEQAEVYRELKKLCARLSGKTEEEMERVVKDDGVRFRIGEIEDNKKSPSKNRLDLTTPPAEAEVTSSSSKGAAKLQQISENLNTLAAKYAGVTNHRGAITDFAIAVGADSQGYATIETANGDEIHIRISNHNANAGHFADKGHYEGNVSVVIKSRHTPKTFVAHDDVELTEYIYTKEDISKDGNLLSQVAESLRQMLETGEYEDLSGKAIVNRSPEYGINESEKTSSRYRMGDEAASFDERQAAAVANRGTVMPGLNEATVRIVDVPRHGYGKGAILNKAKEAAIERYNTPVENPSKSGPKWEPIPQHYDNHGAEFDYVISPGAVQDVNQHHQKEETDVHVSILDKLHEVINESIEVEEYPDVTKVDRKRTWGNPVNDNVLMHEFVGAVTIDGKTYKVRTIMKEHRQNFPAHPYSYEAIKIDVLEESSNTSTGSKEPAGLTSVAKLLKGVEKSYDEGVKLLEASEKSSEIGHIYSLPDESWGMSMAAEASELEQKGAEIASRLNTPVRFVEDLSDISDSSADVCRKKRSAKGWYDTATGEVVIVLPNCDSVEDVEATIFHEVVGHKGLRELIGEERFGEFLRQVYEHASAETRAKINALMARNGWNAELATEEYLAQLAERGFADMEAQERSFWSKVRERVLEFLSRLFEGRKLPKSMRLGDEELRYLLWRAYQKHVDGSLVGEAANVVMQERLGVGRFREQDREQKSVADRIENLFYEAVNGILTGKPVEVGRLTSEGKSYLERLSGMQLKEEVSFVLNPSDLVHIHNRHFGTNEKDGRNIPLTTEDIRAIASIISNPDRVIYAKEKKGNERNLFFFLKENDGGSYNLLEVYADRKGNLTSKSFFKSKEGVSQRVISLQNDPTLYVHDGWGNPLDGAKLPKFFETAKESDESSRLRFRSGNYANAREEYEARVRTITERDRSGEVMLDSGGNKKKANRAAMWHEAYLDSMASLKALQEAVENESGEELRDFENAYWAENRMSSSNSAQTAAWKKRYFEPLMREVSRLTGKGDEGYRNLLDYMMAKHGLERNAYMRAKAEANGERPERDFAGLTALFELSPRKWEEAEQRAQALVATYESAHGTAELWRLVNAATKATLQTRYDAGLISKDVYDKIRTQYQYYLPLKGWADTVAGDVYEYAAGTYHLGTALHSAYGRSSQADDPLATISVDAERTIMEANRNKMKMAFLNMAINHRTSLLTVRRQWYKKQTDGSWLEDDPPIPENATADEVNAIVEQHNADMEALKNKGEAYQSKKGLQLGMRVNKYERSQHIVTVSRAGEIYQVFINGNPRAAMAINGLLNPDAGQTSRLKQCGQSVKNFMSKAFTTYNPEFVLSNLARDVMFAGAAVAVKEDKAYNSQYRKNISGLLVKGRLLKLVYKYNAGTLDMDKDIERYFYEFMTNGGETGFTQINSVDKVKKEMERFIKQAQGGASSAPGKAWRGLLDGVEFMNRCAEDTTRFAVYMTSRQIGRGVARSIWDAKEITVNFNKKGSGALGARYLNFSYVFFNAAMQSLGNSGRLIKQHPGKSAMVMVAFMSTGLLLPLVSQVLCSLFGGDDDDYYKIPEWVRRNNLVLYIPFLDKYLTIPIAHELRPFYGIGELAYSTLMGREDAGEAMYKAVEGFTGLLPVDWTGNGGNVLVSLTPTVFQPLAQVGANVDYFGKPLYRRTASNTEDPEWEKAYRSTHPLLVDASRRLYEATAVENTAGRLVGRWYGDVNPAIVQHLVESYTGGMGKMISKTSRTISMLWDEEARELRNIPIASKFFQGVDERAVERRNNKEYYDLRGEYEKLQLDFRHLNAQPLDSVSGHAKKLTDWLDTPDGRRYLILRDYMKDVDYWQGVGKNAPTERMKERADSMENATKAELIETMRKPDEYPAETIGRRKQELDYDRVRQDKRVERQMKRAEGRMSKGNDKPRR